MRFPILTSLITLPIVGAITLLLVPDGDDHARGERVVKNVALIVSMFVLLLESAMIGVFVSLDLFLFYVFWDAMLIPMYFLIGIWGYERRIYAAIKFILYTMAGSVLMLLAILGLAYLHSTAQGGGGR